jgi:hypothetical protein
LLLYSDRSQRPELNQAFLKNRGILASKIIDRKPACFQDGFIIKIRDKLED